MFVAVMVRQLQAVGAFVEMSDPDALQRGIGLRKTAREEIARRGEAVELQRYVGALVTHAGGVGGGAAATERKRVGFGEAFVRFG